MSSGHQKNGRSKGQAHRGKHREAAGAVEVERVILAAE
jgi:hypothetical protein